MGSIEVLRLSPPIDSKDLEDLRIGDKVLITGVLYTARDAAHERLVAALDAGEQLPFDIEGAVIYYAGPTPAREGHPIGSVGPTTSYRMDTYAPRLIEVGLKAMIGKGARSSEVVDAMIRNRCVYLGATGGTGALIAKSVKTARVIALKELGPEAIRRLEVVDFPAVVVNDIHGGDLYSKGVAEYRIEKP
ncbi:Fe-S-containing hydro-lyase [Thermodesulfobacteriota bacterium]